MKKLKIDLALAFFAIGALACLIVSIPATSTAMDIFHGTKWGWVATAVFELGAVGLELMSLAIPQWRGRLLFGMLGMLAITTAFNYATGIDSYATAVLAPGSTYAKIRAADNGPILTVAAAALFPGMLGGFLLGFTARARMLRAGLDTPMRAVAFWLGAHWLQVRQEVMQTKDEAARAAEDLARANAELDRVRQLAAQMRMTLAQRDAELIEARHVAPQLIDEALTIGARSYAVRQLADILDMPESTLRRRLAQARGE